MTLLNFRDRPLHETNLLIVWAVALAVSGMLVVVDLFWKLQARLALIPRPGLNLRSWSIAAHGLVAHAPLLIVALTVPPAGAAVFTYFVNRARRRAWSSRARGSVTAWWETSWYRTEPGAKR